MMERVTLPNSDLQVSQLCLGCWQFNDNQQSADKTWAAQTFDESKAIVDKALSCGINFLDTAEGYLNSEQTVGRILEGRRRDVVLATKVGVRVNQYKPEDIESSVMKSLQNLKTDYIDLYQIHWPSYMTENFVANLNELKRQKSLGRIRHCGVCNFGPQNISDSIDADFIPVTNQLPYNLLWRSIEYDIIPKCAENNIGIMAYSPLQQGMLTGKYLQLADVPEGRRRTRLFNCNSTSLSKHGCDGAEEMMFKNLRSLKLVCDELGMSMSSVALSWLLQQNQVKCCIVGASSPAQIESNCRALTISQDAAVRLSSITDELKSHFGRNADPWAPVSRMS
ncbi:hypothetical protein CAPTEDRAFT_222791 [Capitella teleta]|uniref:NADP-dependent oxidoreductase domain-containing protein n=1 Tax=Capitella teleta TaxID=283909 RepID=R7VLY8_CAPTE|nr:hypothetical protein CAPTEDRAFT_222791 [Capitella teleta]|eukprot:ELU18050.1 hypothetical protein CAPTEDRAFT_222791 [Capitella teleta]